MMNENQKDWFGIVRWCEDDIAQMLRDKDIEVTEESIGMVREKLKHHSFVDCMVAAGWEHMDGVVSELFG